jgi:hypothetical protein
VATECNWILSHINLNIYFIVIFVFADLVLTLILPTWRIWWDANKASKWQMGFNLAFKGLNFQKHLDKSVVSVHTKHSCLSPKLIDYRHQTGRRRNFWTTAMLLWILQKYYLNEISLSHQIFINIYYSKNFSCHCCRCHLTNLCLRPFIAPTCGKIILMAIIDDMKLIYISYYWTFGIVQCCLLKNHKVSKSKTLRLSHSRRY